MRGPSKMETGQIKKGSDCTKAVVNFRVQRTSSVRCRRTMTRKRVIVSGTVEHANALRRSLLTDVTMIAPDSVLIEENTSSHTDEYIAHRIGLMPFQHSVRYDESMQDATLNVKGRSVTGADLGGSNVKVMYKDAILVPMIDKQELRLSISFARGKGSRHARFQRVVGIGMKPLADDCYAIEYETMSGQDHDACLTQAIQGLRERMLKARRDLAGGVIQRQA